MTVEAVCFDATGTLFVLRESVGTTYARHARAQGVGLPAWRLDDAFARVLRHGPSLSEAVVALGPDASRGAREAAERDWWRDRVRQTFQATDSTVRFDDPTAFFEALFAEYGRAEAWQVRPGIPALLERLARRGLALGVVSHFDHRLSNLLEVLGLIDFFSLIEIPSRAGLAKPDPRVFAAAAARWGCALEALAYVGDDPPETLAAIAAHGIAVFDVRAFPDPDALAAAILGERAATPSDARPARDADSGPPTDPAKLAAKPDFDAKPRPESPNPSRAPRRAD